MKTIKSFVKNYWLTCLLIVGVIAGYQYISDHGLFNPMMFPSVSSIWSTFVKNIDTMFQNLAASIRLLIPSILITILIALSLGILLGMNRYCRKAFYPIIYAFSCAPAILLSPFVSTVCSNFTTASIILIVYDIVFSLIFSTITGIESIDKRYLDNAKTLEIHGLKLMLEVILPAASPAILGGLVNALRGSFVMLVFAEMYGASYGLGYYVQKYSSYGLYQNVWAGFIFMVLILVLVMNVFEKIKDYILRWTI